MQNCNYAGLTRARADIAPAPLMCAVFGSKYGVDVGTYAIEAETHSSERLFLSLQNYNYAALHRV